MAAHIGIDLGTTTTCIAIYDGVNSSVLESSQSNPLLPSTVTVKGDNWQVGKHWPGDKKKGSFIYEAKRLIGRDPWEGTLLNDTKRLSCFTLVATDLPGSPSIHELLRDLKAISTDGFERLDQLVHGSLFFDFLDRYLEGGLQEDTECQSAARAILEDPAWDPHVAVQQFFRLRPVFVHMDTSIELEEISALLLRNCKRQLETRHNRLFTKCTITVPAHFADSQRLATTDAALIAGWEDIQLVNEPTAAAIAHVFDEKLEDGCYLLPDLGGGTFDVSVLSVLTDENGQKVFVVKATGGDNLLGGANFTEALMDVAKLRGASVEEEELRTVCEQAKKELSVSHEAVLELNISQDTISQKDFRAACRGLLDKISSTVAETLASSGIHVRDLRAVIMAGGASQTAGFRDTIATIVEDVKIITPAKPSQLCARGAAFIASGKALITEVLSRSIGIGLNDGKFSVIMHRASPLPLVAEETYFPSSLDEPLGIRLYEGEHEVAKENILIGRFEVSGFTSFDDEFQVQVQVSEAREVEVRAIIRGNTQAELKVQKSQRFDSEQITAMASLCSRRCPITHIADHLQHSEDAQLKRAISPDEGEAKRIKLAP